MASINNVLRDFFAQAPLLLIPKKFLVLSVFILITGFMLYGMMTRFTIDMALESWFQKEDPAKIALADFRKQFGSDDGVYLVYEAADGDVFSEKSLQTLNALHNMIDDARIGQLADGLPANPELGNQMDRIERVNSLINGRYQRADGDSLITKKLIGSSFPVDDADREGRRDIALTQENFELAFYSRDFRYGGIWMRTDFGTLPLNPIEEYASDDLLSEDDEEWGSDFAVDQNALVEDIEYAPTEMEEYLGFMGDLRAITSRPEFNHFRFYYTGNAPLMEWVMNSMAQASLLLMGMVVVVMFFLWFLFRSFSAIVWPIIVIAGSAFWTIGTASWLGLTMSTMVSLTFMLILAVGVADCVHVLSAYIYYRSRGAEHLDAISMAYRKTGLPIFLTTVTTMAGLSALMLSDMPQIAVFGMMSAMGAGVAFILTLFVLPAMLDIWHPNKRRDKKNSTQIQTEGERNHFIQGLLNKIPGFVERHYRAISIFYLCSFALLIFGLTQVKVDSNLAELAKEGSEIRVTYDTVDQNMMGAQNMELLIELGETDAVKDPRVLKAIEKVQDHLEATYPQFVLKTQSIADLVKDTNKVMHGDDPAYEVIPDDPLLAAQLLFLFDNANSRDRRELVSDEYHKTHVTLQLRNAGSYDYQNFFDAAQQDMHTILDPLQAHYPDMKISVTGTLVLMMELVEHISWTQIKSFGAALIIITVIMIFTLGSTQAGLLSMLPNILPACFTFGLMGLLGIALDTDTLIIAPVIIGIAVDDTIHFVAHYRDAWYETGDLDKALRNTISEVGQAVTFTTLILGVGFSVLAFSDYLGQAKTGVFGSLAIFLALSADLFLLPALIRWFKPDLGRKRHLAKMEAQTA